MTLHQFAATDSQLQNVLLRRPEYSPDSAAFVHDSRVLITYGRCTVSFSAISESAIAIRW